MQRTYTTFGAVMKCMQEETAKFRSLDGTYVLANSGDALSCTRSVGFADIEQCAVPYHISWVEV